MSSEDSAGQQRPPVRDHSCPPLNDRGLQIAAAVFAALILGLCFLLTPDERGYGTHTRIGLPRCNFLRVTGIPCPTCGATTSASLFVHGHPRRAWATHPAGVVVAAGLIFLLPAGIISALAGWRWIPYLRRISLPGWTAIVCLLLALCLIGWPRRIRRHLERKQETVGQDSPTSRAPR